MIRNENELIKTQSQHLDFIPLANLGLLFEQMIRVLHHDSVSQPMCRELFQSVT